LVIQKLEKPILTTVSELVNGVSPEGYTYSNREGMIKNELFNFVSGVLGKEIKGVSNSTLDLIARGFKTPKDLFLFIKNQLGLIIPHKVNCGNPEHSAPFQYVADSVLGRVYNMLIIGNRGSAKSFNAGLIQWLLANMYPLYEGRILGGSADQSMKSYEAMLEFWDRSGSDSWDILLGGEPRKSFTKWKTGSSISILTASQKSVRGIHPNTLSLDEVDVMKWDILEAALSTPMEKNDIPARLLMLSTYHNVGGTMARLMGDTTTEDEDGNIIKNTFLDNVTLYKHCIFEILEPCVDYSCSTCPLAFICPGIHMKKAVGYYKIKDFVNKLGLLSRSALESEWLCKRPSRKGLILEVYDDLVNTIKVGYIEGLPVDISIDFGFSEGHEYAIGVFQDVVDLELPDGRVITGTIMVDEIYEIPSRNAEMIEKVKKRPWAKYPAQVIGVADSANKDLINEWKVAGFKIRGVKKPKGSVIGGINMLTSAIKPIYGQPKLYINYKCRGFLKEKDNYKFGVNGEPIKKFDNAIDMVRYRVMSRNRLRKIGGAILA